MAVTTKDLARICGVSRATIGRAFYGTGPIRDETKAKILQAAKEYGYQPDLVARSLVMGKTMTLGIIVVDLRNLYFPEIINGMERRAKESGYLLNISMHEDNKETERQLIQTMVSHKIDGLILSPISKGPEIREMLQKIETPMVILGTHLDYGISTAGIDEQLAGKDAAEFMIQKGYREIALVVPPLYDCDGYYNIGHYQRWQGYLEALEGAGLAPHLIYGDTYEEQVLAFQEQRKGKAGFLCSGEWFARHIMDMFGQRGYEAGRDYGIMSFDYLKMFRNTSTRLTSLNNHIEGIGYAAADLLLRQIEQGGKKQYEEVIVPHEIVDGDTL